MARIARQCERHDGILSVIVKSGLPDLAFHHATSLVIGVHAHRAINSEKISKGSYLFIPVLVLVIYCSTQALPYVASAALSPPSARGALPLDECEYGSGI